LTLKEVELEATREERDTARRDVRDTHLAKDEIIRRAWEVRDQAVARKNAAEIELARTRIDVLQINSQLLEAIQQKIELSQQLEQWQVRRRCAPVIKGTTKNVGQFHGRWTCSSC
jgi:coiled-coil domain-containing protein 64